VNSEAWTLFVVLALGPRIASDAEFVGVYRSHGECIRDGEAWLKHAYDWSTRHEVTFGPIYACFLTKLDQVAGRD
jgi:hypothetical protein